MLSKYFWFITYCILNINSNQYHLIIVIIYINFFNVYTELRYMVTIKVTKSLLNIKCMGNRINT